MLKRAKIALVTAALPGLLAYTGWVELLTPVARLIALTLLGFSAVSFLLSLFDDAEEPAPAQVILTNEVTAAQPVPLIVTEPQVAKVAP